LAQETGHKPKVFASIVLDRLSGFAGLSSWRRWLFFWPRHHQNKLVIMAIAAMSIVSGADRDCAFQSPDFFFCLQGFCGMAQGQRKPDEIAL
jgi:hypothetical protein